MTSLAGCAAAAGGDSVAEQAGAIQGGATDVVATHNYAVGIANKLGTVCSGTLIAPNLVLTARHCVVDPDPSGSDEAVSCADTFGPSTDVANLFVTTDAVLNGKAHLYGVAEIATPKDAAFCGNDIALVRLAQNIPASEALPATPVVRFSIGDESRLSGRIAALGYGVTSPDAKDPGTRRLRRDIPILCVPGDATFDCATTKYASLLDRTNDGEFITQGYTCSGDSGGGAFDQRSFDRGGAPFVLGALSRGPATDTECLAAVYSRTDVHAELIIDTAARAASLGGYPAPIWTEDTTPAAGTTTCNDEICTSTSATDPAPSPAASGGCSSAPAPGSSGGSLLLALVAVAALRRRR